MGADLRPPPGGLHERWLMVAARHGVDSATLAAVASAYDVTPEAFTLLEAMTEVTDPGGRSYFLLPTGIGGAEARRATLLTRVLGVETGYGETASVNDHAQEPYSAREVRRVTERQVANARTYDVDIAFARRHGAVLATTPFGTIVGLGGDAVLALFVRAGGTTYGDLFLLNIRPDADPGLVLRQMIEDGYAWYQRPDGSIGRGRGRLRLARLLHHEERHSRQWAAIGRPLFVLAYAFEQVLALLPGTPRHYYERDAGLGDGGYRSTGTTRRRSRRTPSS